METTMRVITLAFCFIVGITLFGCGGGGQQTTPPPILAIATTTLPDGVTGTSYNQTIQATGGVSPFTWTLAAGALPHNLSLSASTTNSLTISGAPDTGALGVAFTIQVRDSGGQVATQRYSVSIMLPANGVVLSPPSLDFGNEVIGITSDTLTETLTNTTTSQLAIASVTTTGTNAVEFNVVDNTCAASLAAGTSCTIILAFAPVQAGPHDAALAIEDDTIDSPHVVSLSGTGLTSGPNATFSAASLPFGTQLVGTTSPPRYVSLNNYGTETLNIANIAADPNFAETDNCIPSLAPGGTCTVFVTFTPNSSGNISGQLSMSDNAAASPQMVSLSGTGSTNTPQLTGYCFATCQPRTKDLAECPAGQPSKTPGTASVYPCGPITGGVRVDFSRHCHVSPSHVGNCVTQ